VENALDPASPAIPLGIDSNTTPTFYSLIALSIPNQMSSRDWLRGEAFRH
jgi:hypothetical protein